MEVDLSVGTYELQDPPLPQWSAVLNALDDGDFEAVSDLVFTVLKSTPEQRDQHSPEFAPFIRDVTGSAWPLLRKSPLVAQRLMEACCAGLEDASECTATDAVAFGKALVASDVFDKLIALVKNEQAGDGE